MSDPIDKLISSAIFSSFQSSGMSYRNTSQIFYDKFGGTLYPVIIFTKEVGLLFFKDFDHLLKSGLPGVI